MDPSASPPATRSPSSRMRARGRATSSCSPRSSGPASSTGSACGSRPSRSSGGSRHSCEPGDARGAGVSGILSALLIALAACATTTPSVSPTDRWRADLDAYRTRRGALAAEVRQVTDDFQALRAESSFPGLEDKIATLAARVRQGEEADDEQALTRGLWSLSLGELGLFQRYLALSSRVVELEAVDAELEAARLDLWLRRLTLGLTEAPGADPIERPAPAPFACARYPVGRIEFLSCRGP